MSYPTTLDDAASLYFVDAGETILAAHHNILADRIVKLEAKLGIGLANAADADPDDVLMIQPDGSVLWTPLDSTLGTMSLQNANAVNITGGSISGLTGDMAISGNVSATAFIGNGAGLTGIGTGTGGVINTGSTTIGADSDADGVGIISLQVGGDERVSIARDSSGDDAIDSSGTRRYGIGINTNSPEAYFDIHPAAVGAGSTIWRVRTNEAGTADFSGVMVEIAGSNGETRNDNAYAWGYNVNRSGGLQTAGEHQFTETIESRYKTSEGITQLEYYMTFIAGSESSNPGAWRPFSITPNLGNSSIIAAFASDELWLTDKNKTATTPQFDFRMNDVGDGSSLIINQDTEIVYAGTTGVILRDGGSALLYQATDKTGGKRMRFFSGSGGGDDDFNLFPEATAAVGGAELSLTFGNIAGENRSITYNRDGAGIWEFTNDGASYFPFSSLSGTGAANKLAYWSSSSVLTKDDNLTWDATNDYLAIGHATPHYPLDLGNTYPEKKLAVFAQPSDGTGFYGFGIGGGSMFLWAGDQKVMELINNGSFKVWDGAALQTVSFGAADSGGSGYRALRIPN